MSVTFWCPDAPTQVVTPYEDEPDYEETRSVLPECPVSNSNATAMLALIDSPHMSNDEWGEVKAEDVPAVLEKIRVTKLGVDLGAALEKRLNLGVTKQRTARRLQSLFDVFSAAKDHNYSVSWG